MMPHIESSLISQKGSLNNRVITLCTLVQNVCFLMVAFKIFILKIV